MPKINPSALKSIVFIGWKNQNTDQVETCGTGFIVRFRDGAPGDTDDETHALITARHTLDEIESHGGKEICVRFNLSSGGSVWKQTLLEDWDRSESENVDVAVYICRIPPFVSHVAIGPSYIPGLSDGDHFNVQVTDDVAILGLFVPHNGRESMIPIARLGTIAALADSRETVTARPSKTRIVEGIEAHLVEIRSIGGVSGSPVFAYWSSSAYQDPSFIPPTMFLLGLVSGHFPYTESRTRRQLENNVTDQFEDRVLNAGIAYVTPASKIVSVLKSIDMSNRTTRLFYPLESKVFEGGILYQMRNLKSSEILSLSARLRVDQSAISRASVLAKQLKAINFDDPNISWDEVSAQTAEFRELLDNDSVKAAMELISKSGFRFQE